MKHRTLFLLLAAVSLLGPVQACSSASKAAEVATDQPAHADYSAPEGAIMARDAALTYVEHSMDVSGLTSISDWRGQDVTPTNLVGQTTIEFTSGDWRGTIAFPVVAPEHVSIVALRDHAEPGKYAHFWGTLRCDVPDVGRCQLLVTRLRRGTT